MTNFKNIKYFEYSRRFLKIEDSGYLTQRTLRNPLSSLRLKEQYLKEGLITYKKKSP